MSETPNPTKPTAYPPGGCFEYPSCECGETDAGTPNGTSNPPTQTTVPFMPEPLP
jgi:hypothetical protein